MTGSWDGPDEAPRGQRRSNADLYLPCWAVAPIVPVQAPPAPDLQRQPAPDLLDGGCKLFRLKAVIKGGAGVRLRKPDEAARGGAA